VSNFRAKHEARHMPSYRVTPRPDGRWEVVGLPGVTVTASGRWEAAEAMRAAIAAVLEVPADMFDVGT
jgi:hypothetical protein